MGGVLLPPLMGRALFDVVPFFFDVVVVPFFFFPSFRYTQKILHRRDMITSRILLVMDNAVTPTSIDHVKGLCAGIQLGLPSTRERAKKNKCVPMEVS